MESKSKFGSIGAIALAFALTLPARPAAALSVLFDYRYDTSGFFDPQTRATLEAAGQAWSSLSDSLAEIAPGAGETWSTGFLNPGSSGVVTLVDLLVPADSIVVFVGGRPLVGALGFASAGQIWSASGSEPFIDTLEARGQLGALEASPTDFGPWGGAITFNSNAPWHRDAFSPVAPGRNDLFTTAVHEIAHILGIGEAPSWNALVASGHFHGANAVAAFGGPVPVDPFGAHFASGADGLMDPSTPAGVREFPSELDVAALRDLGWRSVPEPSAFGLLALLPLASFARGATRRTLEKRNSR